MMATRDQEPSGLLSYLELLKVSTEVTAKSHWRSGVMLRRPKERLAGLWLSDFDYTLQPLPESCIRLLRVEAGRQTDVIRCSLRVVDLRDKPKYTAVSYSWREDRSLASWIQAALVYFATIGRELLWHQLQFHLGLVTAPIYNELERMIYRDWTEANVSFEAKYDKKKKKTIICNGKTTQVLPNLYDVLLQLRQSGSGDYWFDALCIDQSNVIERAAQVQMMGEIYRNADSVLVWLGEVPAVLQDMVGSISPTLQRLAQRVVQKEAREAKEEETKHKATQEETSNQPELIPKDPERETTTPLPAETERNANDLDFADIFKHITEKVVVLLLWFTSRRWFRRIWVLQEVALARRTTFLYSRHELEGETLATVLRGFRSLSEVSTDFALVKDHFGSAGQAAIDPSSWLGNMFSSLWGNHIVTLHRMLDSDFFRGGGLLTLEEWLLICKGREATDPRDLIYAGLSIIKPETLQIERSLQLDKPQFGISNGPSNASISNEMNAVTRSRLWDKLYPTYTVEAPEVLLNLAACLLSKPGGISNLFKFTLRFRNEVQNVLPEFDTSFGSHTIEGLPSWIPDPSPWAASLTASIPRPGKPSWQLSDSLWSENALIASHLHLGGPKISHDGTTLFLSVTRLATITSHVQPGQAIMRQAAEDLITFLSWIVHAVPRHLARPSGLAALASTLAAGRWKGSPINKTNHEDLMESFCAGIHNCTYGIVADIERGAAKPDRGTAASIPGAIKPSVDEKTRLLAAYHELCAAYPDQPWPTPPAVREETQSEENYATLAYSSWSQLMPGFISLSVFTTKEGYLGVGSPSLREGDVVMLTDADVPYIFAHIDEVLRRRVQDVEKDLSNTHNPRKKRELKAKRSDLASAIGTRDAWELVGEAYVNVWIGEEEEKALLEKVERVSLI